MEHIIHNEITSYGIILIYVPNYRHIMDLDTIRDEITEGIFAKDSRETELFAYLYDNIKFLIVERKHTLGYVDFIRGNYNNESNTNIVFLFQQMSNEEISKIKDHINEFEYLWHDFWGYDNHAYGFNVAKKKYYELQTNKLHNLDYYLSNVFPLWKSSECGFPKGRKRNKKELPIRCAIREFKEETGIHDFEIIKDVEPLEEIFTGTDGRYYKHVYYIALTDKEHVEMFSNNEVKNIRFLTFDQVITNIREYHKDRKSLVVKIINMIINNIISKISKL